MITGKNTKKRKDKEKKISEVSIKVKKKKEKNKKKKYLFLYKCNFIPDVITWIFFFLLDCFLFLLTEVVINAVSLFFSHFSLSLYVSGIALIREGGTSDRVLKAFYEISFCLE